MRGALQLSARTSSVHSVSLTSLTPVLFCDEHRFSFTKTKSNRCNYRSTSQYLVNLPAQMESEICDFCSFLDLAAVGFYDSFSPPRTSAEDRQVRDILRCSTSCVFYKGIADFCYPWKSRKSGDLKSMNFEDTSANIGTFRLSSSEADKDGNPLAFLIYLSVTVTTKMPDPFRGYCGPCAYFQKVGPVLGNVSNLVREDTPVGDIEPYTGRLRPLLADLRLFRKWKELCCKEHQGIYDASVAPQEISLWLIDVEKRFIVNECRNISFFALSYVWGANTKPFLTQSTKFAYQREGSLDENNLPAIIYDTLKVTLALGERYLRVDTCCIVQDDEQDKLKYIPRMDLIYGLASVTMIATSGIGAEAGLPGVKEGSRRRVQEPFTIKGIKLIETLDPNGNGEVRSYLGESVWNERGWTFQERLLSRRALVFTHEQVYWECQWAFWSEGSHREFISAPTIYRHSIDDEFPRQPLDAYKEEFERLYRILVGKYSGRLFTNEEDHLSAFSSILEHFRVLCDEHFVWGLPEPLFSSALTWPCETSPPSARKRRTGLHPCTQVDGTSAKCPFPSWSWVGWVCEVYLAQCSNELQPNATGLGFYNINEKGHLKLIHDEKAPSGEDAPVLRTWRGMENMAITDNISQGFLSTLQAHAALFIWSSIATLRLQHDDAKFPSQRKVYGSNDLEFAARWKQLPASLSKTSDVFSAVVVGDTDTWGGHKDYLNIMLVSWVEGIAYREVMLSMLETDWVKLDRTWRQIILC